MSIRPWPSKDPDSRLPYWFNWTDWLAIEESTIVSYAVVVDEGDTALVISDVSIGTGAFAGFISLWLSGGTSGTTYVVRCRVTLANGAIEDASRKLEIDPH